MLKIASSNLNELEKEAFMQFLGRFATKALGKAQTVAKSTFKRAPKAAAPVAAKAAPAAQSMGDKTHAALFGKYGAPFSKAAVKGVKSVARHVPGTVGMAGKVAVGIGKAHVAGGAKGMAAWGTSGMITSGVTSGGFKQRY